MAAPIKDELREELRKKFAKMMSALFKQKTAYEIVSRDWSSDVCSSDLLIDKSPLKEVTTILLIARVNSIGLKKEKMCIRDRYKGAESYAKLHNISVTAAIEKDRKSVV